MTANELYLVCEGHPQPSNALRLGERDGAFYNASKDISRLAEKWFTQHATCGHGDHFRLAYAKAQNWDYSPPAQESVAGGVRLALLNGEGHGPT